MGHHGALLSRDALLCNVVQRVESEKLHFPCSGACRYRLYMTENGSESPQEHGEDSERAQFDVSHPQLKEFSRLLPELNRESDRGRVLISCSYLDELIKGILQAFFIECSHSNTLLEGFNAPLGTLDSRLTAAYALGLLTERELKECHVLRRIKNRFAHEVHTSFDHQDIQALCKNLSMAAQSYGDVVVDARGQYTTAAVSIILRLTNRHVYVSRNRCQSRDWPV